MKRFRVKICKKCGKEYKASKYSKICDECRSCSHQIGGNTPKFNDAYPGRSIPMSFVAKKEYEKRLLARKPNGKIQEYKKCPNFDGTRISCVSCPEGVWEFKACGRKK